MSNILVTGVAGLIGSHLSEELARQGNSVYGIDNESIGIKENVPFNIKYAKMDMRNYSDLESVIEECKPEVIFHCACTAYEGLSQFSPRYVTENTYNISLNLFGAAIKQKVKRIVSFSSMAVYGNQIVPFNEEMPTKPEDIYGIAKVAMEKSLEVLSDVHGIEYTILRPHNVIGERQIVDPYRNVAMIFMNRILQNKPPIIYSSGEQKRSFSYIGDSILPMIRAGFQENTNKQIINIGPTEEYSINQLADCILKEFDREDLKPIYIANRPREVKNAWCTNEKAKNLLGFETKTSFEEGIHKMAEYVKRVGPKEFKYLEKLELEGPLLPITWRDKIM